VKFSTYTRDSATVLDYADQRYYASTYGRFLTPDRYRPSADLKVPQSWNKYGYVQGEPINSTDPAGLIERVPDPGCDPTDPDPDPFCQPDPGPAPPPDPPSLPDPLCSISLWERPTPSGGPAKGLGEQTYILVTESDWAPFYPNGLMIEGGPVHHKLTSEINQPGQGLAAGKWERFRSV